MNIKLETKRGETVYAGEATLAGEAPDVLIWAGRVFRFVRTDGIWDQTKHVYCEASVHDMGDALGVAPEAPPPEAAPEAPPSAGKKTKDDRQISATLSAAQAALLKRVKARGAFASPKAALIAGLEALDEKHTLSNDALLKLLAERLSDTQH